MITHNNNGWADDLKVGDFVILDRSASYNSSIFKVQVLRITKTLFILGTDGKETYRVQKHTLLTSEMDRFSAMRMIPYNEENKARIYHNSLRKLVQGSSHKLYNHVPYGLMSTAQLERINKPMTELIAIIDDIVCEIKRGK